jgi:nicotinamide-nucleotide amidase
MNAEVISIGDELTSGQRLDTNSQWLSQRLLELGVRVLYHTTVVDDLQVNTEIFRQAAERVDLVIVTGGLGPTADDLTRDALAAAAGVELELNETAWAHIRALFARRKRDMPQRNIVQAMFPQQSRMIPNPHGTAPGIDMDLPSRGRGSVRVFALPGVPAEMREMWGASVAPAILEMQGDARRVIRVHTVRCFGVGESDLEAMLPDLIRRGREPTVGITVSHATISLRILAEGGSEAECQAQIESTATIIRECLGELVFGEGEEELSHAVIRLAGARGVTIATGESGSGGLLASWLSEADSTGRFFRGGLVRRARSCSTLEATIQLADEARRVLETDYGLALSDFPDSDSPGTVPGNVYAAHSSAQGVVTATYPFAGHPDILRTRATKQALNLLRLSLRGSGRT